MSWELEEGPRVHISAFLSVTFLPAYCLSVCPFLEPLNSSLRGKKEIKGVKSQSKIHRLTGPYHKKDMDASL